MPRYCREAELIIASISSRRALAAWLESLCRPSISLRMCGALGNTSSHASETSAARLLRLNVLTPSVHPAVPVTEGSKDQVAVQSLGRNASFTLVASSALA